MSDLDDLQQLVPAPGKPVPVTDELRGYIEDLLGGPVHDDDIAMLEAYGPGSFSEFVSLLHPAKGSPEAFDLLAAYTNRVEPLEGTAGLDKVEWVGEGHTLVPFLFDDNGDTYCWHRGPKAAAGASGTDVVAFYGRPGHNDEDWYHRKGTAVSFVVQLVQGKAKVPFLPEDWPPQKVTFDRV